MSEVICSPTMPLEAETVSTTTSETSAKTVSKTVSETTVSVPVATETQMGVGYVATDKEVESGVTDKELHQCGPAFVTPHQIKDFGEGVISQINYLGKMEFTAFVKDELSSFLPGWYMMDGSFYSNKTDQSKKLNALPDGFKKRMGIVNDGEQTCVPNFFYEDGRGYMIKAVNSANRVVGSIEQDAYPEHKHRFFGGNNLYIHPEIGGGHAITAGEKAYHGIQESIVPSRHELTAAIEKSGSGNEVLVLNIGLTPIIYLGV